MGSAPPWAVSSNSLFVCLQTSKPGPHSKCIQCINTGGNRHTHPRRHSGSRRAHRRKKPGKPMHELVERQHTEKCFEAINTERRNRDNTEVSLSLQFLACNLWSLDHKAALPGDSASPEPRHCSYSLASPASSISWCPRGPHLAPIHHSLLGYCKRAHQVCHLLLITGARQGTFTEHMLYI